MSTVVLPSIDRMRASIARDSLKDFVKQYWDLVEPSTELIWSWHLDVLCDLLESITRGEIKRCIINIPPGTMKSLLVSVMWPCWEWATNPHLRYLCTSYTEKNTLRDNTRSRSIVSSSRYVEAFGVQISPDQGEKRKFETTDKGFRLATSIGGQGTGEHPHRIIIDDPIKAIDVRSEAVRRECIEYYKGTISTRKALDPAIIVIMQRLHEYDLSGYLLEQGSWHHLLLPMRYEIPDGSGEGPGVWDCPCHKRPDPRDIRTKQGELLCPDLWPEKKVRETELDLGPFGASGQLQQRARAEGAGFFPTHKIEVVDSAPVEGVTYRGWDTAGTEGDGDYSGGVLLRDHGGIIYILHAMKVRVEEVDKLIVSTAKVDGKGVSVREEREPASSGITVIKYRSKQLAGFDYAGVPVSKDKVTRARPFRAQVDAGNVKIVRGEWNREYLDELAYFPVGKNDDYVDATSCAYNALALDERRSGGGLTW